VSGLQAKARLVFSCSIWGLGVNGCLKRGLVRLGIVLKLACLLGGGFGCSIVCWE